MLLSGEICLGASLLMRVVERLGFKGWVDEAEVSRGRSTSGNHGRWEGLNVRKTC